MAVTSFGTPVMTRATSGSVTATWGTGQARTAGHLLVAAVSAGGSTASAAAISTPAGWTQQVVTSNVATTANAWVAVYTKVAAGGDSAPAFTATLTGTVAMTVTLLELAAANDLSPVDTSGTYGSGGSSGTLSAMTVTTAANVSVAGEYAVTVYCQERAAGTNTWNGGGGWTNAANDGTTGLNVNSVLHTAVDYQANPASAAALSETGNWTTDTTAFGTAIIVAFGVQSGGLELFTNDAATTITSGGGTAPAAGTAELWTAASWSQFATASPTTTPPTTFHIADPGASSELIQVVNTSTGLVVRGVEGTTPVSHSNGFTVRNVISAGAGVGFRQQVYNVRAEPFNATGNGSTDDTAAIQAALTASATAGGGAVYVPEGVYIISQTLQIGSSTQILGPGIGSATIRVKASSLSSFVQVGSNTGCPMICTFGNAALNHVTIGPGITFDGNQANAGGSVPGFADGPECAPVSIWNSSQVIVQGVEVLNAAGYSIYLQACSDSFVTGNRVLSGASSALGTDQQDGIHLTGCLRAVVSDNIVDTGTGIAGDDGIALQSLSSPCDYVTISGNVIRSAQSNVHLALDGGNISNVTISGNVFWGSSSSDAATVLIDTSGTGAASVVTISGNTFQANASNGLTISAPFTGVAVTDNAFDTFTNSGNNATYVEFGSDFSFCGNTITNCAGLSHGIQVGDSGNGVTNFTVSNNLLDMSGASSPGAGILIRDSSTGSVSNNTVIGVSGGLYGILISGTTNPATGVAVNSNRVTTWTNGIVESNGGSQPDYNTILGNDLHGCTNGVTAIGAHTLADTGIIDLGGVPDTEQFGVLTSPYTTASHTVTTLQQMFNWTASGALTIQPATYFFQTRFSLSGMTTGTFSFGFLGTAGTAVTCTYTALAAKAALTEGASLITSGAAPTSTALVASTATATGHAIIDGYFSANTAGTVIPAVAVSGTTTTAPVVGAGSWFRCIPVSANSTATFVGNWS